jgi:hypothetical protein
LHRAAEARGDGGDDHVVDRVVVHGPWSNRFRNCPGQFDVESPDSGGGVEGVEVFLVSSPATGVDSHPPINDERIAIATVTRVQ